MKKTMSALMTISVITFLLGIAFLSIGVSGTISPYSIAGPNAITPTSIAEDNSGIIEDGDDVGDVPDLLYIDIGEYVGWVVVSPDGNSIQWDGQWYFIPGLSNIIELREDYQRIRDVVSEWVDNVTDPDGDGIPNEAPIEEIPIADPTEDDETVFDINEFMDEYIPDETSTQEDPIDNYIECDKPKTMGWYISGIFFLVASPIMFIIAKRRK